MPDLLTVFPNYLSDDSIFQKMVPLDAPWNAQIAFDMDDAYFSMYSGLKPASKFTMMHFTKNGFVDSSRIAHLLLDFYGTQWKRLWDAYTIEYNPIDNYNIKENIQRNATNDRTINQKTENSSSSTGSNSLEHGENIDTTDDSNSFTFAFNDSTKTPTGTVNDTGTEAHSGTDTTTTESSSSGSGTEETTDNDVEAETIERTRTGNVGQNSYQELMRQEFELWRWNFFTQVFEDVDKFLALSVYDVCQSSVNQTGNNITTN